MTGSDGKRDGDARLHRRRPGIRLVYSAIAIVGGIILAARFANGSGAEADSAAVFIGALVIIGLGLVSVPIFLWMDRRGL